jgi:hypothetical protein
VIFVFDPTNLDPYNIPLGKQKLIQEHIFYTPCSGIWQTVWLESAPAVSVEKLDISAGADGKGRKISYYYKPHQMFEHNAVPGKRTRASTLLTQHRIGKVPLTSTS